MSLSKIYLSVHTRGCIGKYTGYVILNIAEAYSIVTIYGERLAVLLVAFPGKEFV